MRRKLLVLAVIVLAIIACRSPFVYADQQPTPMSISDALLTPSTDTATLPTPFQPVQPTPSAIVQFDPTPEPQVIDPTPATDPTEIASVTDYPTNRTNILILGSDWRPASGFRTDVIVLVSINPVSGTVSLISFPRDLYVYIPGIGDQRINTAQEFGGFELTKATFEQNFGINIDYYIITNFAGFQSLIDTLGGVEINASQALSDRCDLPQAVDGSCYIDPGYHAFDGQTALWYVRSRYSSSDFDRTRRAQEVLLGVFHKMMSLNAVSRAPELYQIISSNIETNLDFNTIASLLSIAPRVLADEGLIHRYAVGPSETTDYIVPGSGAMVLLPNYDAINAILSQAFSQ
jgi:LCP family protein required for cell wall assembly